jgi:hypothetical protein
VHIGQIKLNALLAAKLDGEVLQHLPLHTLAQLPDFPQVAAPDQVLEEQETKHKQLHIGVL